MGHHGKVWCSVAALNRFIHGDVPRPGDFLKAGIVPSEQIFQNAHNSALR
jgi:hypothetical protein